MIRLFEQHHVRRQKELDGIWNFTREDGKIYHLPVPGCLEQHPELGRWRGTGTYTRNVTVEKDTAVRFSFKGVSHTADVWFDGEKIAHHYNAFTPFEGIVKNVKAGIHELKVGIDNTFSEASALHVPNDYYTYGGITRPVVIEEIPDQYLSDIRFLSEMILDENGCRIGWKVRVEAKVSNLDAENRTVTVSAELAGKTLEEKEISVDKTADAKVVWESEYTDVEAWEPGNPQLYLLTAKLKKDGVVTDDLAERVGFRQVTVEGQKICINGKPVFMKGFNRHEDFADFGCAIPPQMMALDLDLIEDMGGNAVRTCHYPNDERFLDMCDERGIMVWEENHARGFGVERMTNPNFDRQCEDCIREMINAHYNHPSIVIWGILNECASETEIGREKYKRQYEQILSMDSSRPRTSATCRHFTDICLDIPEVVSFNIYSGWYENVPVAERHEKEMDWIASAGGAGKPVIISEFGAGAVYGFRDHRRSKWSEERQADILKENLEVYEKDERLSGLFIWQFADCRVTEEEWFAARPRSYNNKGIVDEYRRPKEAYELVKEIYRRM